MTENTNTNKPYSSVSEQRRDEMKKNMISFALMIGFTIIAFTVVATGNTKSMFIIPILLIMCLVQVAFQFYFFMHLKEKGHAVPAALIYGGVWAAFLCIAGLGYVAWW